MGKSSSDDEGDDSKKFNGEASGGTSWVEFDTQMSNRALKAYGLALGEDLWRGKLLDLSKLDLSLPEEQFAFDSHCEMVHRQVKTAVGFREAESMWWDPTFWTMQYQLRWRSDQYVKIYLQMIKVCRGEAKRQLEDFGHVRMAEIRTHFMVRFGSAQRVEIKARERQYSLGMPAPGQTVAFPEFVNMPVKLNTLEAERTYFWKNCPIEMRPTYRFCKIECLVHVILDHISTDYEPTVLALRNLVKVRKMVAGDASAGVTTRRDTVKETFSDDWLPDYPELRDALVEKYDAMVEHWTPAQLQKYTVQKIPMMMMAGGHPQPGVGNMTCYGCGVVGHRRGDSVCTAGAKAIWDGAPDAWKKRISNGGGKNGNRGRGNGKAKGRGRGNRNGNRNDNGSNGNNTRSDGICRNFSSGNGYCRFGDSCKFLHSGKKGGGRGNGNGNGNTNDGNSNNGNAPVMKLTRRMKKEMTSTVMKTIASTIKKSESSKRKRAYDADDDDESSKKQASESLYNILSQADSCFMTSVTPSRKPSKWNKASFTCMMTTNANDVDDEVDVAEEVTQEADPDEHHNDTYVRSWVNDAIDSAIGEAVTSTLLAVVHAAPAVGSNTLQSPSRTSSSAEMGSNESDLATDSDARAANIANAIAKSEFRPPSMGPPESFVSYSRATAEKKYVSTALKQKYEPMEVVEMMDEVLPAEDELLRGDDKSSVRKGVDTSRFVYLCICSEEHYCHKEGIYGIHKIPYGCPGIGIACQTLQLSGINFAIIHGNLKSARIAMNVMAGSKSRPIVMNPFMYLTKGVKHLLRGGTRPLSKLNDDVRVSDDRSDVEDHSTLGEDEFGDELKCERLLAEWKLASLNEAMYNIGETSATAGSESANRLYAEHLTESHCRTFDRKEPIVPSEHDVGWVKHPDTSGRADRTQPVYRIPKKTKFENLKSVDGWFISPSRQHQLYNTGKGIEIGVMLPNMTSLVGVFQYGIEIKKQVAITMRCNLEDLKVSWYGEVINDEQYLCDFHLTIDRFTEGMFIEKKLGDRAIVMVDWNLE